MKSILVSLLLALQLPAVASPRTHHRHKPIVNDSVESKFNANMVLHVKKAAGPISLDGLIDEPDWRSAEKAGDFHLVLPVDSGYAKSPSEVVMTYDDHNFYLGATFFDTIPGKRIAESFRRDFAFGNNDNLLVFFDTFLDQTNGYSFGASASGAQWDGTMSGGSGVNLNWDCKWDSKTVQYPDRWVIEMKIPFRSIRYKSGTDRWYVNFSRLDLKTNEKSAWAPVPRQFPTASLAYTGVLQWDHPLPKSPMTFSLIPYLYGSVSRDFEALQNTRYRKDIGFDAKLGLTTSLNLDLTYNPDFSQADVDQQVTNIDRFELFFPEKRQFFLENSDLFSGFGFGSITPFFSRRIGLDAPVLAGMRLSGKPDKNWRIGLLDMQTEKTTEQLARNFLVFALQRQLFSRSNISIILVNKENLNEPAGQLFNRVAGIDYNLASADNKLTGKLFYHRSFSPENSKQQFAQGFSLGYNSRRIHAAFSEAAVGRNYVAETGYVPRKGFKVINPELGFLWIPNRTIVSHGISSNAEYYFDFANRQLDHVVNLLYKFELKDRSVFDVGVKEVYSRLEADFDPTHISHHVLAAGTEYSTTSAFADFFSDTRKMLNFSASAATGGFYNGTMGRIQTRLSYRYQPYLNMSLNLSYNDINLPAPFERSKFWIVGPKIDLTMSEKAFFTAYVQYNNQIDNMNVNLRFQWRYQPVSDLFIVYTDNYYTGNWSPRNRALVVKLTYWFN